MKIDFSKFWIVKDTSIDNDSYLKKIEMANKSYKKDDLKSNQEHFAELLKCIIDYFNNERKYWTKAKLYDDYREFLRYCEAVIINREIPKYRIETLNEEIFPEKTILINRLKFNPETFGEIRYVDEILNLSEYNQEKLKAVAIAQFWTDYEKKDDEICKLKKEIEDLKKNKKIKNN